MLSFAKNRVNSFLWRFHQVKLSSTFLLMLCEPPVSFLRWSVDCSFHISIVRRFAFARTITSPPPFSTIINFIMKCMIHCDMRFGCLIDAFHVLLKLLSMIVPIEIIMRYKQIRMDHLVLDITLHHCHNKESIHCIGSLSKR